MATTMYLLLVIGLLQTCLADNIVAKKPSLLEVLTELKLTSFLDGLKKCRIDRIINHEGKNFMAKMLNFCVNKKLFQVSPSIFSQLEYWFSFHFHNVT